MCIRDSLQSARVPMRLFDAALAETRPSVTPEMEEEYRRLLESLKRENPRGLRRIGFGREEAVTTAAAFPQAFPAAPAPSAPPAAPTSPNIPTAPPPLAGS